jgi:hypothetical protein
MATTETIGSSGRAASDDRAFFRALATAMAIMQVAGFAVQLAAGRSSFDAPLIVHLHAGAFMGWVAIFVTQPWLAKAGAIALHRVLGRVALVWAFCLLALGVLVTWAAVHTGRTPFFFQPQHFLIANPVGLIGALSLFAAAVALRKRQDWHARLQIGSFALLMGPSFGRLLPMPLLTPYAFEIASIASLVFVAFAAGRDGCVQKRAHPAWAWPVVVLLGALLVARLLADTPLGADLYAAAVADTSAAGSDGMAFPPAPMP